MVILGQMTFVGEINLTKTGITGQKTQGKAKMNQQTSIHAETIGLVGLREDRKQSCKYNGQRFATY